MKFEGPVREMKKQHHKYAKHGRSRLMMERLEPERKLSAATLTVMSGCRRGVDTVAGLETSALHPTTTWMGTAAEPLTPLSSLVSRASDEFKAKVPAADHLGRKRKKRHKKLLVAQLEHFLEQLTVLEQLCGYNHLGRRVD